MATAQMGHLDVFELLLEYEANLTATDYFGNNVLHWACAGGHVLIIRNILE